ncbi:MAG: hypothetical protein PHG60_01585 [Candidatus Dojkabacteria bacterium]|jgi:hypothetical protein|nr:hypothetical protein [Candidatus Dojkabacteria bacterium]MDD2270254.1 hypothetical protein [Candidatus Dojkabacteria bacterium]
MPREKKEQNKQLGLKLKESPLNSIAKYKERFELFRAQWDIKRYTKSNWVWLIIILSVALLVTQIYTIQESIHLLPKKIPLFQIYVDANKTLAPTKYVYLIPIISASILILGIIFSNKYYNRERSLSNTLLWGVFLGNLVITISLIRLINLY